MFQIDFYIDAISEQPCLQDLKKVNGCRVEGEATVSMNGDTNFIINY
jgi:hypothetical protein